jgi:DNA-binding IclR family transcriptional regulator
VSDAALTTVQNAARVLKAFLGREEQLGPSELGRRLGLGKSTVHRLLTTLVAEGLIEQDSRTGGYRLGIVMFELGEAVRIHMDLHTAAAPVLAMLREETRETAQIGVLDRGEVVYVDRLESSHSLRLFTETGRRVPAHCTSSGKVLLAFLAPAAREDLLSARPLAALTPDTITDPARLRLELARARVRGWAEAVNEREIGVASIAAPVRDSRGEVVAAISIGAPLVRLGAAQRRRYARAVTEAGDAVSRRLGWSSEADRLPGAARHGRADDPRLSGARSSGRQPAGALHPGERDPDRQPAGALQPGERDPDRQPAGALQPGERDPDRRPSDAPMGALAHADR